MLDKLQAMMKDFLGSREFDEPVEGFMDDPIETDEPSEVDGGEGSSIGMTEQEIRDQGWLIDLPFESGSADPQEIEYKDFGDKSMKYDPSKFPNHKPTIPAPEESED